MNIEKLAKKRITELKDEITSEGFIVSNIERKSYNFEIQISKGNQKLKVLIYFGKKGVKTVLQGNSGSELFFEVNRIVNNEDSFKFPVEEIKEPDEYIGTDETGKGDFFGPLVVAGVYVDKNTSEQLKNMGVIDSKELSDSKINIIAKNIFDVIGTNFSLKIIEPVNYNEIYKKLNNLNMLLNELHTAVIDDLVDRTGCREAIVDKFSDRALAVKKIDNETVKVSKIEKGERFTGVAAASILARAAMNKWFENFELKYFQLPKGAGLNVENRASEIKLQYGEEIFEKIAKLHFKTLKKI